MELISVDPDELRALASAVSGASQELASVSSAAGGVSVDAGAPSGGAVEQIGSASSTWTAAESRLFSLATDLLQRAAAFDGDAPSGPALSSALGCCSAAPAAVGSVPTGSPAAAPSAVGDAAYGGAQTVALIAAGGGAGVLSALPAPAVSAAPVGLSSSWLGGMDAGGDRSAMVGFVGGSALPSDLNPHAARAGFGDGSRGFSNLVTGQGALSATTLAPTGGRAVLVGGDSYQGVGLISSIGGGRPVGIGYDTYWP